MNTRNVTKRRVLELLAAEPVQAAALAARVVKFKVFLARAKSGTGTRPRINTIEQLQHWAQNFGLSVSAGMRKDAERCFPPKKN